MNLYLIILVTGLMNQPSTWKIDATAFTELSMCNGKYIELSTQDHLLLTNCIPLSTKIVK